MFGNWIPSTDKILNASMEVRSIQFHDFISFEGTWSMFVDEVRPKKTHFNDNCKMSRTGIRLGRESTFNVELTLKWMSRTVKYCNRWNCLWFQITHHLHPISIATLCSCRRRIHLLISSYPKHPQRIPNTKKRRGMRGRGGHTLRLAPGRWFATVTNRRL